MDHTGKKSVRFTSPFESAGVGHHHSKSHQEKDVSLNLKHPSKQQSDFRSTTNKIQANPPSQNGFDESRDSWDAFDAKMTHSKRKVQSQFAELSFSQNKSLPLEDPDFSPCSFQDAKDIIEKDEKEHMMFMNSNVSFSDSRNEGIDQVDPPSLLSFTSYFQQGSCFPDSLLMIKGKYTDPDSSRQEQLPQNSAIVPVPPAASRRSSSKRRSASFSTSDLRRESTYERESKVTDLSRNDSLHRFFLGPESNGMGKAEIMDYVLEYCKRRASSRLSDASSIAPSETQMGNDSNDEDSKNTLKHDSGVEFGNGDNTISSSRSADDDKTIKKSAPARLLDYSRDDGQVINHQEQGRLSSTLPRRSSAAQKKVNEESSVMIAEGGSIKKSEGALDMSDIGFEKFKKNLHRRGGPSTEDRFRAKLNHHAEFEKKRLNVDERFSHPNLSPRRMESPPYSTMTLERPNKNYVRSSPPEKLSNNGNKNTSNIVSETLNPATPSPHSQVLVAQAASSQCHSTPLNNESYVSKLFKTKRVVPEDNVGISKHSDKSGNAHMDGGDKQKRSKPNVNVSAARLDSSRPEGENKDPKRSDVMAESFTKYLNSSISSGRHQRKDHTKTGHEESFSKQNYNDLQKAATIPAGPQKVLKSSNPVPTSLSIMPPTSTVESIVQQQIQHHLNLGNPPCSCSQHGTGAQQMPATQGMVPGVGMPIVIHIHLPCAVTTPGTFNPAPTPSIENPKQN